MSLLVLGSTGTLGRQIVRKALDEGFQVKCFVRNFRKAYFLRSWGAELVYGDLKLPETIPLALFGITAIIDASTARSSDLCTSSQIDLHGKYILIEAAQKASVKRYVFFSILNSSKYNDIPLMRFKYKIEQQLIKSNLNYTIFVLPGFFQGIISQYALPILEKKSIWITDNSASIPYIDTIDVAKITIKSLSLNEIKNRTFPLIGQNLWNSTQIIELCEKLSGQRSQISRIHISALKLMRKITYSFQWTWNIADRLAFTQVISANYERDFSMDQLYDIIGIKKNELHKLDEYLQEYFTAVMKKLKELNYQIKVREKNDDQLF